MGPRMKCDNHTLTSLMHAQASLQPRSLLDVRRAALPPNSVQALVVIQHLLHLQHTAPINQGWFQRHAGTPAAAQLSVRIALRGRLPVHVQLSCAGHSNRTFPSYPHLTACCWNAVRLPTSGVPAWNPLCRWEQGGRVWLPSCVFSSHVPSWVATPDLKRTPAC